MKTQSLIAGFALAAGMALLSLTEPAREGTGRTLPDGTVYAGISPDTSKPIYTTPADAPSTHTFDEADAYCSMLNSHGHKDWRVPTKSELNVLFNHRAAIGGFNVTGSYPGGWYGSSSQNGSHYAWGQRFSDGSQFNNLTDYAL